MPYCIYLRKSRADDELEAIGEDTLARHEKALLSLAKSKNIPVTAIYKEVVSGETIASRPQMQQLLSEVEAGAWEGVLAMEVERLARGDTIDQGVVAQAFKYTDTLIVTPAKTYNPNNEFDEEYFEFGLFMSRREYKAINRRLQRGRATSVSEGKWVGNKTPYGYTRIKLQNEKGYSLEIVPEQAEIVELIYDMFANKDMGSTSIAIHLNDLGIKTASGLNWATQTVSLILKNPVYYGKIKWGGRPQVKRVVDGQVVISRPRTPIAELTLVDGLHKAIISEETYKKALTRFANNPLVGVVVGTEVKNPIVGLVKCGVCGKNMCRRDYKDRQETLLCATLGCDNVSSDLYMVEDRIISTLIERLRQLELAFNQSPQSPIDGNKLLTVLTAKKTEYNKLKTQLDALYDLLEQGVYTKEVFLERNSSLTKKLTTSSEKIIALEASIAKSKQDVTVDIIPKIKAVVDNYYSLNTPKERNNLLKTVVKDVEYIKKKSGRWHNSPDNFSIVLTTKL